MRGTKPVASNIYSLERFIQQRTARWGFAKFPAIQDIAYTG